MLRLLFLLAPASFLSFVIVSRKWGKRQGPSSRGKHPLQSEPLNCPGGGGGRATGSEGTEVQEGVGAPHPLEPGPCGQPQPRVSSLDLHSVSLSLFLSHNNLISPAMSSLPVYTNMGSNWPILKQSRIFLPLA